MERFWVLVMFCVLIVPSARADEGGKMQITSPAFKDKEAIPETFTCHGSDISPELNFVNVPLNAKSLALVVDDPDAPEGTWVHWVIYDIPPTTAKIAQNSKVGSEGLTDFGSFHYRGPCPNNKRLYHYSFRLYALSERIELNEGFIKSDLEHKMKGKILAEAELVGIYKNPDKYNE